MISKRLFPLFLFFLFSSGTAWAHPHVFVDARVMLLFDGDGLAGFREEWTFDEMFGEFILGDYDANGNKRFEPAEIAKIKAEAFDNLKDHAYFHIVKLNGKPFDVKWVTDFTVRLKEGRVVYGFTIPCHVKVEMPSLEVSLSLSDPTIYTDIVFTKDSPQTDGNSKPYKIAHRLDDGVQPGGQVLAQTLRITVARR